MSDYFIGDEEYFKGIGKIQYEGRGTDNPLAFRYYDSERKLAGKKMKDHLRFAIAYWHSFCADGTDMFGKPTLVFPWSDSDPLSEAEKKADAAFEFITKIGAPYYCFHDVDIVAEDSDPARYVENYHKAAAFLKERQDETGVKLLWNTANMFSNPRYMNGAASNPDFDVVARAALQVKTSLDVNVLLGGENYVFWGGREGYMTLLNTDMKREKDHIGTFFRMARDYGRKIGFKGTFLIEPKPMEPMKHQYDYDAETAVAFIKAEGLEKDFKCNIEANHATLAGHTFAHDLQVCADNGMLGSVDANQGDQFNGWDTDEFPSNVYDTALAMYVILRDGGLKGGLNFDAKRRRNSTDMEDLFLSHIGGMDAFALGLIVADRMISDGKFSSFVKNRYSSFDGGQGRKFELGQMDLETLSAYGRKVNPNLVSGKQEYLNNLLNSYLFG